MLTLPSSFCPQAREHEKILRRQNIIEERKEMLENQNLEREESIRRAQEEQMKKQKEEERLRWVLEEEGIMVWSVFCKPAIDWEFVKLACHLSPNTIGPDV